MIISSSRARRRRSIGCGGRLLFGFLCSSTSDKNETKINSTVPTAETVWNSQSRGRHRPEAGTAGLCFAAKQRGPARPDTRGAPASSLSPFTSRPHWQRRRIAVGEPLGRPSAAARGTPDAGGDGLLVATPCTEAARLDLLLQEREGGTRRTTGIWRCSGETAAPGPSADEIATGGGR